jgi:hypothetical protein
MNLEVIQKDIMILKERYDSLHEMVLENIHKNERSYIELDMKIEKSLGDIKHDVNGIKTSLSSILMPMLNNINKGLFGNEDFKHSGLVEKIEKNSKDIQELKIESENKKLVKENNKWWLTKIAAAFTLIGYIIKYLLDRLHI